MRLTVCANRPLSATFDLLPSARGTHMLQEALLRTFRRRQKVHASGALFRTRVVTGLSVSISDILCAVVVDVKSREVSRGTGGMITQIGWKKTGWKGGWGRNQPREDANVFPWRSRDLPREQQNRILVSPAMRFNTHE